MRDTHLDLPWEVAFSADPQIPRDDRNRGPRATRQAADGTWIAIDDLGDVVAGGFATQAAAYRWIDRQNGEPISPAQKRADFVGGAINWKL